MIRNLPLELDKERLCTGNRFLHEVYTALKHPERPEEPPTLRFFAAIRTYFADGCALVANDATDRSSNWTGDTRLTEWINTVNAQTSRSTSSSEPISGYDAARQTCYLAVPIQSNNRQSTSSYMIFWRSAKLFTIEDLVTIRVAIAIYLGQPALDYPQLYANLKRPFFTFEDSDTLAMETQLKSALDEVHELVIICGGKGEISWSNRLARETLGLNGATPGTTGNFGWLMLLVHPDDVQIISTKIQQACETQHTVSFSVRLPKGIRQFQLFECHVTPCLRPASIIKSWIFTAWQADRFLLSQDDARISDHGLASLIHNLRVPLGTCKMTLENLVGFDFPADVKSQLEILQQAIIQLYINVSCAFIITERPEQEFKAKYSTMCLEEFMDALICLRGPELIEKDLEVFLRIDPNLPKVLYTDELRFKQIICNIISMGLRDTPKSRALILRLTRELTSKGPVLSIRVDIPKANCLPESHHVSLTFDLDLVIIEILKLKVDLPILDHNESVTCDYRTRQVEIQALNSYMRSLASSRPIVVHCSSDCEVIREHFAYTFSLVSGISTFDSPIDRTRLVVGAVNVCIVDVFDKMLRNWLEKQDAEAAKNVRLVILRSEGILPPAGLMHTVLTRPLSDVSVIRAVHEAIIRSSLAIVTESPISPEKATSKEETVAKCLANNLAEGRPMRIMVVEDSILNLQVLVKTLNKLGFLDIVEAVDGQEGYNKFILEYERGAPIELIFMDMQMPVLDGCSSSRKIREYVQDRSKDSGKHSGPHIVAMTANSFTEDRQACLAAGMCSFAGKPVQWERLEQLIIEAHDSLTGNRACTCHNGIVLA